MGDGRGRVRDPRARAVRGVGVTTDQVQNLALIVFGFAVVIYLASRSRP
jgi:hypothetical protein